MNAATNTPPAPRRDRSAVPAAGNAQILPIDDRRKQIIWKNSSAHRWHTNARNSKQTWQLRANTNNGDFGQPSDFPPTKPNGAPVANNSYETLRDRLTAGQASSGIR